MSGQAAPPRALSNEEALAAIGETVAPPTVSTITMPEKFKGGKPAGVLSNDEALAAIGEPTQAEATLRAGSTSGPSDFGVRYPDVPGQLPNVRRNLNVPLDPVGPAEMIDPAERQRREILSRGAGRPRNEPIGDALGRVVDAAGEGWQQGNEALGRIGGAIKARNPFDLSPGGGGTLPDAPIDPVFPLLRPGDAGPASKDVGAVLAAPFAGMGPMVNETLGDPLHETPSPSDSVWTTASRALRGTARLPLDLPVEGSKLVANAPGIGNVLDATMGPQGREGVASILPFAAPFLPHALGAAEGGIARGANAGLDALARTGVGERVLPGRAAAQVPLTEYGMPPAYPELPRTQLVGPMPGISPTLEMQGNPAPSPNFIRVPPEPPPPAKPAPAAPAPPVAEAPAGPTRYGAAQDRRMELQNESGENVRARMAREDATHAAAAASHPVAEHPQAAVLRAAASDYPTNEGASPAQRYLHDEMRKGLERVAAGEPVEAVAADIRARGTEPSPYAAEMPGRTVGDDAAEHFTSNVAVKLKNLESRGPASGPAATAGVEKKGPESAQPSAEQASAGEGTAAGNGAAPAPVPPVPEPAPPAAVAPKPEPAPAEIVPAKPAAVAPEADSTIGQYRIRAKPGEVFDPETLFNQVDTRSSGSEAEARVVPLPGGEFAAEFREGFEVASEPWNRVATTDSFDEGLQAIAKHTETPTPDREGATIDTTAIPQPQRFGVTEPPKPVVADAAPASPTDTSGTSTAPAAPEPVRYGAKRPTASGEPGSEGTPAEPPRYGAREDLPKGVFYAERTLSDGRTVRELRANTADLTVEPGSYQHRRNMNAKGTTGRSSDVKTWSEPTDAISVWLNPETGTVDVINGHHRMSIAERSAQTDVPIKFIDAATKDEAKFIGFKENLKGGQIDPIDAADYFRQKSFTPEQVDAFLTEHGISKKIAGVQGGRSLAALPDSAWSDYVLGKFNDNPLRNERRAVALGDAMIENALTDEQKFNLLDAAEGAPDSELTSTARRVKLAGTTTAKAESGLFGEIEPPKSLVKLEGSLQNDMLEVLAAQKKSLGSSVKNAEAIKAAGIGEIDTSKGSMLVDTSKTLHGQAKAFLKGDARTPIDDFVTEAARAEDSKQMTHEAALAELVRRTKEWIEADPVTRDKLAAIKEKASGVPERGLFSAPDAPPIAATLNVTEPAKPRTTRFGVKAEPALETPKPPAEPPIPTVKPLAEGKPRQPVGGAQRDAPIPLFKAGERVDVKLADGSPAVAIVRSSAFDPASGELKYAVSIQEGGKGNRMTTMNELDLARKQIDLAPEAAINARLRDAGAALGQHLPEDAPLRWAAEMGELSPSELTDIARNLAKRGTITEAEAGRVAALAKEVRNPTPEGQLTDEKLMGPNAKKSNWPKKFGGGPMRDQSGRLYLPDVGAGIAAMEKPYAAAVHGALDAAGKVAFKVPGAKQTMQAYSWAKDRWFTPEPERIGKRYGETVEAGHGEQRVGQAEATYFHDLMNKQLDDIPAADRDGVYRYLGNEADTIPASVSPEARATIQRVADYIDTLRTDLVNRGRLSPEAYNEFSRYLTRQMQNVELGKHAKTGQPITAGTRPRLDERWTRQDSYEVRLRMPRATVERFLSDFKDANVRAPDESYIGEKSGVTLLKFEDTPDGMRARDAFAQWVKDRHAQARSELNTASTKEFASRRNQDIGQGKMLHKASLETARAGDLKVETFDPITPEMRDLMGEVTDPAQAVGLTIAKIQREIATHDMLQAIVEGGKSDPKGEWVKLLKEKEVDADGNVTQAADKPSEPPDGYVYLANKRLGPANETFVRADVAKDLVGEYGIRDLEGSNWGYNAVDAMRGATDGWKVWRTVRNPAGHAQNIISAPVTSMEAGVSMFNPENWQHYSDTFDAMRNPDPFEPMQREIIKHGIDEGAHPSAYELGAIRDAWNDPGTSKAYKIGKLLTDPTSLSQKMQNADLAAGRAYNFADRVIRQTAYRKLRAEGLSPEAATIEVDRCTTNYAKQGSLVKQMRHLPFSPFITYAYERLRILKNNLQDHPTRAATTIAGGYALQQILENTMGSGVSDEEKKGAHAQYGNSRWGALGNQNQVVIGRNEDGSPRVWDTSALFTTDRPVHGPQDNVDESLLESSAHWLLGDVLGLATGPVGSEALAQATGRDALTGKELLRPKDRLAHAAQTLAPPFTPFVGGKAKKIAASFGGEPYAKTKPAISGVDALLDALLHIRIDGYVPEKSQQNLLWALGRGETHANKLFNADLEDANAAGDEPAAQKAADEYATGLDRLYTRFGAQSDVHDKAQGKTPKVPAGGK